jgi:hypothetical protein
MKEYNAAFFSLYENWFKLLKNEFGENKALELFRKTMETGLTKAYEDSFAKGTPSDNKLIYQFHTDPFPNLKNEVSYEKLDDTYISFKVRHLLGDQWKYKSTKHIWNGDNYT